MSATKGSRLSASELAKLSICTGWSDADCHRTSKSFSSSGASTSHILSGGRLLLSFGPVSSTFFDSGDEHPDGRISINAKRKDLTKFMNLTGFNGDERDVRFCKIGCKSIVSEAILRTNAEKDRLSFFDSRFHS